MPSGTPTILVGDKLPEGTFPYVPYTPQLDDHSACGIPTKFSTNDWAGKKVVLFSVPGAFTPTCHVDHLPGYLQKYEEFKGKGVDVIAVLAANDPFVMSGWARFEGLKDKIITLSDINAEWSAGLGLSLDLSHHGFGTRSARYAMIIDDLVVKYVEVEPLGTKVTVSGADAVLSALDSI
ncbi:thioredoxin-dependent peroxidase [Melanogaster broomeanus]|nr:thioredoxin-dependent peroxidase [Melanogaster broomeanus]